MGKVSDNESRVIARRLAMFIPSFYLLFYVVAGVFIMAYDLDYCGTLPFEHAKFADGSDRGQAALATTTLAFLLAPLLMVTIVKSSSNAWDYVVTVALLHVVLAAAVSASWPSNWRWWATVASMTLVLAVVSELINYLAELRRTAKVADALNS
ncbi:uncharacterized protein AMSG_01936 [Thecamonas trahens ATCC 50062]|uniref:Uncharacterized protein n=1 Tax=Thecamonas trahens ATCC 50062 TaxID=461836 RepID=A0A0L0DUD7_THETB|nr:hypothetical protein AMSG_01936 [Thecamonas trahens ATCC 50062]KNC55666.1 hypothetical protein AMSG_01936 [Thecamonas trahens ATCC 50062]|eukprot:XP_013761434.1 hypothetical protein AMSG_01936 [Thecamonas trahens ATCC 50062]